jgi:hypothetical protein
MNRRFVSSWLVLCAALAGCPETRADEDASLLGDAFAEDVQGDAGAGNDVGAMDAFATREDVGADASMSLDDAALGDVAELPDALVDPDAVVAPDALVDPDAFTAPDAFASPDAFVMLAPDAFVSPDAFSAPDAHVAPDAFAADAFTPPDAFIAPDAWVSAGCAQIANIRTMTGTFASPLVVSEAIVSAITPATPTSTHGVFVQCIGAVGPALFLAIPASDRTAFPVAPAVGMRVSFEVTSALRSSRQHRVTGIRAWTSGAGSAVAPQDITAINVPPMIDALESELVTVTATLVGGRRSSGTGFSAYDIVTPGVSSAAGNFLLRMPDDLAVSLALQSGCEVTLPSTVVWRFNTQAQLLAFAPSDVQVIRCPDVIINEVDYDMPGPADSAEFIELYNGTDATLSLTGYSIVLVNGMLRGVPSAMREYDRIALTGSIAPGDYVVLTAPARADGSFAVTLPASARRIVMPGALTDRIQNGSPDAVVLMRGSTIIDSIAYEGVVPSFLPPEPAMGPVTVVDYGATAPVSDESSASSLSRTLISMFDWALLTPTPGTPN